MSASSKHVRKSDVNFTKFLLDVLTNDHVFPRFLPTLGTMAYASIKEDGFQFCFWIHEDGSISGLCSHNGHPIGPSTTYTCPSDIGTISFMKVDIGAYLQHHFPAFKKLFAYVKAKCPTATKVCIFQEVMMPVSPLKIPYADDIPGTFYVFELKTKTDTDASDSFRINEELSAFLSSIDLTPAPLVLVGAFTPDFVAELCFNLAGQLHCEGIILYLPDSGMGFKIKQQRYDTSSAAGHLAALIPTLTNDTPFCKMARSVVAMLEATKTKLPGAKKKRTQDGANQDIIMAIMVKEVSHHDWKAQFASKPKSEYGVFFEEFTGIVIQKLLVEQPDFFDKLSKKKCVNYIKRGVYGLLKPSSRRS